MRSPLNVVARQSSETCPPFITILLQNIDKINRSWVRLKNIESNNAALFPGAIALQPHRKPVEGWSIRCRHPTGMARL
ncbi:hypothetical protein [Laspinema olomoucense]|uniref:Uncharacterized protein n=1 Tax=Laspinema olomoucense D3b TaxID=2953688 RepID=A0ABT2N1X5_9CYAN|nr:MULTISPECIES: hypothetical protein [unclassified Laspinema]MCT7971985.1 hypothetical protein [Laspinema sp. D3d]MCT7976456.1 hypothetical protein [Laspinema sp. D3b]MCT7994558.1 hypothetical protein [Laspinema sp. D3c]